MERARFCNRCGSSRLSVLRVNGTRYSTTDRGNVTLTERVGFASCASQMLGSLYYLDYDNVTFTRAPVLMERDATLELSSTGGNLDAKTRICRCLGHLLDRSRSFFWNAIPP